MKVTREDYFRTLEYVNELNIKDFKLLDLSEFFVDLTEEKREKIKEKMETMNNFNIIYLLITQEQIRKQFNVELNKEKI